MKWVMNYLRNNGYEVLGRNPKKSFVAFKYDKNDKLQYGLVVRKKLGLYSLDFTNYRDNPNGELECVISPYMADLVDFLKGYEKI